MAETTVLKSSASPRSTGPRGANAHVDVSGPLPKVSVTMGSGGRPQVQGKDSLSGKPNVQVFPVKGSAHAGTALSGAAIVAQRGNLPPVIVDHRSGKPSVQQQAVRVRAAQAQAQAPSEIASLPVPLYSKEQLGLLRFLVLGFIAGQNENDPSRANARELAIATLAVIDEALAAPDAPAPAAESVRPPMRRVVSAAPTSKIAASAAPRRSVVQDVHVPAVPPVEDPAIPDDVDDPAHTDDGAQS